MSRFSEEIKLIEQSGLFDRDWYIEQYPDVKFIGVDPIQHYLRIGALLHRNPSTEFVTAYYVSTYPDVVEGGENPLVHYINHGRKEGRQPRPLDFMLSSASVSIDVIVPVYNALDDVRRCLESLSQKTDNLNVRVIVVDDGSDASTKSILRKYCSGKKKWRLIENNSNIGYTKSVNVGLRASTSPFVVTLNSDTIVTTGWLKGLLRCATARPEIGIVGPLSNAASWQNVPQLLAEDGTFAVNELPSGMTPDTMARTVASCSKRRYPGVPFVNGFCFMIRREVINAIGYLDEVNFPIGYGEENDYCIRAQDSGYKLAVADDVFVFHAKSKSFGHAKRKTLSEEGSKRLQAKHGYDRYKALVNFVKDTRILDQVREDVSSAIERDRVWRNSRYSAQMKILFLLPVAGGGGGTHSIVQETCAMRRLGFNVQIAVKQDDYARFIQNYPEINDAQEVFVPFLEVNDAISHSSNFDVVIATVNTSVELLKAVTEVHPHILPVYYVQDYEPLFYPAGSDSYQTALRSYTLVPQALHFAKTHWIAEKVKKEHGIHVHKVEPSIDHHVYFARPYLCGKAVKIAAMVRPQTPVRGAERTMRVLSRLARELGETVEFHLFGCEEDNHLFQALDTRFEYTNHGVLKRSEVADVLASCDIFVDFSDYQAFGRTALEAMACSCVSVVPAHGGTDEYAIDGYNSAVVDTADEDECYDRLLRLVTSQAQIDRMKLNALCTASRFSTHAAAVSELALLAAALSSHRAVNPVPKKPKLVLFPAVSQGSDGEPTLTGSAYVRLLYPYRQKEVLRQWDVETRISKKLDVVHADVAILQRDVDVTLEEALTWISDLRSRETKLIYEIDDDLLDGAGLLARGYKGNIEELRQRVTLFAQSADLVTVSTESLATKLRAMNSNIVVVPNYLDRHLWGLEGKRSGPSPEFSKKDDVVRIGYIGTPTHDSDLAVVREAIEEITKKYEGKVEVEVIGAFQNVPPLFGNRVGLPRKSIYPVFVEWLKKRVGWDIAIIPLAENEFNKSKSNLKFLECAALDMAIICSAVPTYADIAKDGANCLEVSNRTEEWVAAIERLVASRDLRKKLAMHARAEVASRFVTTANVDDYLNALNRALFERSTQARASHRVHPPKSL